VRRCLEIEEVNCGALVEGLCGKVVIGDNIINIDCVWNGTECVQNVTPSPDEECKTLLTNFNCNKKTNCIWNALNNKCYEKNCEDFSTTSIECEIGSILIGGSGCYYAGTTCYEKESSCTTITGDGEVERCWSEDNGITGGNSISTYTYRHTLIHIYIHIHTYTHMYVFFIYVYLYEY
jgi:hypothetical protein